MRVITLIREALMTAWANKVPSALIVLLVAVMCAGTLATVGQTAAAEDQLDQRLDSAGARVLTVVEPARDSQDLINPLTIQQVARLSVTERAVGTETAIDVVNGDIGPGGENVPAWGVAGDIEHVVTLTSGRWPAPGEALVSRTALEQLNMDSPTGWIEPATNNPMEDWAIVGTFQPREPFEDYANGVVYPVADDVESVTTLHVVLTDAETAPVAQPAVVNILDPPAIDHLSIQSPLSLAQLSQELMADFTTFGRTLLFAVLGGGAFLVAIITLADVLVRRKDLGRRRALGATRSTIVSLVVTRTAVPAIIGALIGITGGITMTNAMQATPPWDFNTGTAILAVLAAVISAMPPAIYAATRDPVQVLRTP